MYKDKDNLPALLSKIENKNVEKLLDSGCNGMIISREQVDESKLTEEMGHIIRWIA